MNLFTFKQYNESWKNFYLRMISAIFKLDEEYLFAQKVAWASGQAYSELLDLIDNKVREAEFLTEKEQGKHKDKLAEAMS